MFIPNGAEWRYDPKAKKPALWLSFVDQVCGSDDEKQLLQEWFGYTLSGDTWAHKGLIIIGPPRAGKGTIGHILSALLGNSMVTTPALHTLGDPFGLQSMVDKRMCLISDARLSNRADIMAVVEILLRIIGGDEVEVHRKYRESVTTRMDARVLMLSNEMPLLADGSEAITSRFLLIQLAQSFLGREDHKLLPKLMKELPGIALWAMEGYRRLIERGFFVEPKESVERRGEWYEENNPVKRFVDERCTVGNDQKIAMSKLYAVYSTWAEEEGLARITSNAFSRRLRATLEGKIERVKGDSGERFLRGVALRSGADRF